MAEYIEREAFRREIDEHRPGRSYEDAWALTILDSIPAADVRPVIFCKDCDCWNEWDSAGRESLGNYVCSCAHWTVEDGPVLYTRPTDFCSYGERIEES